MKFLLKKIYGIKLLFIAYNSILGEQMKKREKSFDNSDRNIYNKKTS